MAEIINFQAERMRRGKDHVSQIFQNLERGPDMVGVSDEQLVKWATELATANGDETLVQIVDRIGKALENLNGTNHG